MNNTLKNGLLLLEFLAGSGESHSIRDIAEQFSLPDSHVHRLLSTMKESGYVEQAEGRRYRGSLKLLTLSHACLGRLTIRSRVRPYVDELARSLNRVAYLMVPSPQGALVVDAVYPGGLGGDPGTNIGTVNPVHMSAGGKVCCAFAPPKLVEKMIENCAFEKNTDKTISSPEELNKELEKIRKDGFATIDSERSVGCFAVAAPIFNSENELCAAIGVPYYSENIDEALRQKDIARTVQVANNASFALGYRVTGK